MKEKMVGLLISVSLILANAILGVQSQNPGHCLDTKINSTAAGRDACAAITAYIECLLQELNLFKDNVSEHDTVLLQNVINEHLVAGGLQCTVDIPAIVLKMREYLKGNVTRRTKSATGYAGARSMGDCANTLTRLTIQTGAMRCRLVIPYLACALRVTGLYQLQLTDQEFLAIESQTKSKLHHLGLRCEFDIRELRAEVARSKQRLH